MTDAAVIRAVYPRHTMKRLAAAMNIPIDTARHWLFRKVSAERRRDLALALLAEMDRQDAERRLLRRTLYEAAGKNADALARLPARATAEPVAERTQPPDRAPAGAMGRGGMRR